MALNKIEQETHGISYDFDSIMHYSRDAFSKNGRDTITTLDPRFQSNIGQAGAPSFKDLMHFAKAYCQYDVINISILF